MSDLNIKLNLETTAAQAGAATVQGELNKLKTDAEKPIKINVDASQLAGAAGGAGKLKEALGNVQAAALGELSQKAGQLGASLGGVAGSLAEVAIKSAAAFGPVGIAITAVLAGLALIKQAIDEDNAATERTTAIATDVANANNVLGGSYSTVASAANAAKDATAAHLAVAQQIQTILQQQIALMAEGSSREQAAGLGAAFQAISDSTKNATTGFATLTAAMVANLVHVGSATQQQAFLGESFNRSTAAAVAFRQEIELTKHVLADHARQVAENALARRAALIEQVREAQERVNSNISDREHIAALRDLDRAQRQLVASRSNLTTATASALAAERELRTATHATAVAQDIANEAGKQLARQRLDDNAAEHRHAAEAAARAAGAAAATARHAALEAALTSSKNKQIQMQEAAEVLQAHNRQERLDTLMRGGLSLQQFEANATTQRLAQLSRVSEKEQETAVISANLLGERLRQQEAQHRKNTEGEVAEASQRNRLLSQQGTFTGRMNTLMGQQKGTTEQLAGSAKNALGAIGTAMASHAQAMIQGKEDIGDALQGMLKDVLSSIGSEAMIKGAMMMAEGAAALAGIYTAPLAAGNFAAGAAFFGVGALASAAGGAIPASASAGGGGGGASAGAASSASTSRSETPMRSGGSGASEAPANITINFSAFQSNEAAQALIVRSLRESGYGGRTTVGSQFSSARR